MSDQNDPTPKQKPSLGNTLFLGGACIGLGLLALLIGLGVIPPGSAERTAGGNLLSAAVGALFIFAGLMIFTRDFAGAKNNEDLPAHAPAFLRFSASLLNVLLLAVFAAILSAVAFGYLPGMYGISGILLRIFAGAFALLLWYGVIYLAASALKKRGNIS